MSTEEGVTQFGFEWGQVKVTRCMEYRGSKVLLIEAGGHVLEVAVSPKGQNIRAFLDNTPMTTKTPETGADGVSI